MMPMLLLALLGVVLWWVTEGAPGRRYRDYSRLDVLRALLKKDR